MYTYIYIIYIYIIYIYIHIYIYILAVTFMFHLIHVRHIHISFTSTNFKNYVLLITHANPSLHLYAWFGSVPLISTRLTLTLLALIDSLLFLLGTSVLSYLTWHKFEKAILFDNIIYYLLFIKCVREYRKVQKQNFCLISMTLSLSKFDVKIFNFLTLAICKLVP